MISYSLERRLVFRPSSIRRSLRKETSGIVTVIHYNDRICRATFLIDGLCVLVNAHEDAVLDSGFQSGIK